MDLPLALVVACVDERHRLFHQLQDGDVAGGTDLQCAELGQPVDNRRGLERRHGHYLLEREAEPQEFAHHPGQVGHAGRVAGEHVNVGRDRVRQAALLNRRLGHRVIEASAAVANIEDHPAYTCVWRSTSPGVTSLPVASSTWRARVAGMSASTASIRPKRMPISRCPRKPWLGSRTSPPLITRSNLSFGPMAAAAVNSAPVAVRANEPEVARNWRRVVDILLSPSVLHSATVRRLLARVNSERPLLRFPRRAQKRAPASRTELLMTAAGLVSQGSPVQTALRN